MSSATTNVAAESPVIIVGAGASGLATGACLKMRGIQSLILEAGEAPGATWRSLYDRLHLHTVKRLSGLPGYPMPRRMARYPSRTEVAEYLAAYAKHFDLRIETSSPVTSASTASLPERRAALTSGRRCSGTEKDT